MTWLVDELGVVRQAVDDLREELAYELRKLRDEITRSPSPNRPTSMPRDPCAEDFSDRADGVDGTTLACFLRDLMAEPPLAHVYSLKTGWRTRSFRQGG